MRQSDRECFLGRRMVGFSGEDNLDRMTRFIDGQDWEVKAAEIYAMLLEHHCASTGRANAAARTRRLASIIPWVISIVSICAALALSDEFGPALVLLTGIVAFVLLFLAVVVMYARMEQS